eukprot:TRINITY_DN2701_c0_g2_i4.p1 TRINITY_DN2701_c0_g2~~TRINITY_DN2701_c0_g2_i4.p1  ORF type:complete len:157 (+),score=11.25 TRINITY_DN2701_c0_g2_i4:37-507(+)
MHMPITRILSHSLDCFTQPEKFTALHFAAKYRQFVVVQILVNHGADLDALTSQGKTASDYAYECQDHKILALLPPPRYTPTHEEMKDVGSVYHVSNYPHDSSNHNSDVGFHHHSYGNSSAGPDISGVIHGDFGGSIADFGGGFSGDGGGGGGGFAD